MCDLDLCTQHVRIQYPSKLWVGLALSSPKASPKEDSAIRPDIDLGCKFRLPVAGIGRTAVAPPSLPPLTIRLSASSTGNIAGDVSG
mmetsp:Transcript_219/g.597  ORF Transcript_219/g.597 Transcript_219/m.597 type:complete len:87 (-) Transcript_219:281-541(-)